MQRVYLAVIHGLVDERIFTAAQGLLDFIYYAQYSSYNSNALIRMEEALNTFHANKDGFVNLEIREHFNISKFHNLLHYLESIRSHGSPDGYNTERAERLHIDYAKKAYAAVSRVDYIAQMTQWLQRQEAVYRRAAYISWIKSQSPLESDEVEELLTTEHDKAPRFRDKSRATHMAASFVPSGLEVGHGYRAVKKCQLPNTSVHHLETEFDAPDFVPALQLYLDKHKRSCQIPASSFDRFDVYHSIALLLPSRSWVSDTKRLNKICAHPKIPSTNPRKPGKPAIADTALIVDNMTTQRSFREENGFEGTQLEFHNPLVLLRLISSNRPSSSSSACHFQAA